MEGFFLLVMGCIQSMGAEANAPKHLLSNFSVTFLYRFCMEIISISPFRDKPKLSGDDFWDLLLSSTFLLWWITEDYRGIHAFKHVSWGFETTRHQNCWVVWRSKPCQKLKTSHFLLPRLWSTATSRAESPCEFRRVMIDILICRNVQWCLKLFFWRFLIW